jgi:hypothetical protein
MRARLVIVLALSLAVAPAAGAADATWLREATGARAALERSVKAGYIDQEVANRDLGILAYARAVRNRVPPGRAALLDTVLGQVAARLSPTAARALVLYGTLAANAGYLLHHRIPTTAVDTTDADGITYRWFPEQGLQFHPLANAAQLNALLAANDVPAAQSLADALAARAVAQPGGAAVWEYEFDFGNERAPWQSGLAQAVMAQALARAGRLALARQAYRAIPGRLDRPLPAGPWIRLYSGRGDVVLNAQLQSAISIGDYAQLAGDGGAAALANRLLAAAKAMLPRFDTGHWSRYSLGVPSNVHYQDYVIELLGQLATRTGDPVWADEEQRLQQYETEPPFMTGASVTRTVYPRPQDGILDRLVVRYYLSKPAKVALVVDGTAVDGYTTVGGWNTFRFAPHGLALGPHTVRLVAQSIDGHPGATDLGTFEIARDHIPPELAAAKAGGVVYWRAKDGQSACCRIALDLTGHGGHRQIVVARPAGSATIPSGYWLVTVVAHDAAGNRTERPLGLVIGPTRRLTR